MDDRAMVKALMAQHGTGKRSGMGAAKGSSRDAQRSVGRRVGGLQRAAAGGRRRKGNPDFLRAAMQKRGGNRSYF